MLRRLILVTLLFASAAIALRATEDPVLRHFDLVTIDDSKTSIYIGSVTLKMTPFVHKDGAFHATYSATVFPYFFWDEKGSISIEMPDDALQQVAKGEVVYFKGKGMNDDHEERRIEGRVIPADATSGKIKVRVFVTKKTQLIFNSTYHLTP